MTLMPGLKNANIEFCVFLTNSYRLTNALKKLLRMSTTSDFGHQTSLVAETLFFSRDVASS